MSIRNFESAEVLRRYYLVLKDSAKNHNKHYYIAVISSPGEEVSVRCAYGRIGSVPTETNIRYFRDQAAAKHYAEKLANSKTHKGYLAKQHSGSLPKDTPAWYREGLKERIVRRPKPVATLPNRANAEWNF